MKNEIQTSVLLFIINLVFKYQTIIHSSANSIIGASDVSESV